MPVRRSWLLVGLVLAGAATVLFLAATLIPKQISTALSHGLRRQTVWQPNSPRDVDESFVRDNHATDPPVTVQFHLFNVTNMPAVKQGAKPELAELGPYEYVRHQVKHNVTFDQDGRVHFRTHDNYLPGGVTDSHLNETVVTANLPLLGVLALADRQGDKPWLQILLQVIETFKDHNTTGLFMHRTVRELLWGYEDPLLARLKLIKPDLQTEFSLVKNQSAAAYPERGPDTVVNTGVFNSSSLWDTEVWQNITAITSWSPPHVEGVRGTDATRFRPELKTGDSVRVWAPDLYRSIELVSNDSTELNGVNLLHFTPNQAQGNPDPRYFQTIQGLMNVTSPTAGGPSGAPGQPGAPIFMSMAHYCHADPALADGVHGLACNPDKHITYIDVEPITGITFRAAKRLMLSTEYGPQWSALEPHVRHTFLPMFWVQEASEASQEQCDKFSSSVYGAQTAINAIRSVGLCLGVLATLAAAICLTEPLWNSGNAFRATPSERDPETATKSQQSPAGNGGNNNNTVADAGLSDPLLSHRPAPVATGRERI